MLSEETRDQIERRALEISAELEKKLGPYRAEIVPPTMDEAGKLKSTANWHVITTWAAYEEKAADFLADRSFGVFVPRFAEDAKLRRPGAKDIDLGNKLIFPGRILIFVWDVLAHWRRIKSCPGVASIMVNMHERPIVVTQEDVSRIQALQFSLSPLDEPKKKNKRGRYGRAQPEHHVRHTDIPDDVVRITCQSYWLADAQERTRLLDKALALPTAA